MARVAFLELNERNLQKPRQFRRCLFIFNAQIQKFERGVRLEKAGCDFGHAPNHNLTIGSVGEALALTRKFVKVSEFGKTGKHAVPGIHAGNV